MKNVGVWMDKEKAHIVTMDGTEQGFTTLESEVEDFNVSGGSRSKTRWGPQDVVQDSKYSEREKHQLKRYFKTLAESLADAGKLVVFGPADTNKKFEAWLKESNHPLASRLEAVKKADSMTENQVKALVREFYED